MKKDMQRRERPWELEAEPDEAPTKGERTEEDMRREIAQTVRRMSARELLRVMWYVKRVR